MKAFLRKYGILLSGLLLIAFFFFLRSCTYQAEDFNAFCEELFKEELAGDTLNLHFTLTDPAAAGITDYEVTLGSVSKDTPDVTARELNRLMNRLLSFDLSDLDETEAQTYEVLYDYVTRQQALSDFPYYEELLSPSGGITSELPVLLSEYSFYSKQDVEDYLALLGEMEEYFDGVLSYEKEKASKGLFMSDEACAKVIEGCEVYTENPTDNIFSETFESRLDSLISDYGVAISDSERADYIYRNNTAIAEHVIPAFTNMISGLTALLGSGQNDWGLCCYEDGRDYYEALAAAYTGCDDGVENLFAEIEEARKEDLAACGAILAADPSLAEKELSLPAELKDETAMLTTLETAMLSDFPEAPKTEWEIAHVDPALSDFLAPAFYITAPLDDYLTNRIYINDANENSDIYYFTTLAHEGFPGHLYQTVFSYESGLTSIRALLNYPGYTEGWATYAEMCAYYYAGLDDDAASLLQHNQAATLSLYATSDIGIHYYGWKNSEMTAFWKEYGITDADTVERITELILEQPANYLKYYVGYLKFRTLSEGFKDRKSFNSAVLNAGPCSFSLLETTISTTKNVSN